MTSKKPRRTSSKKKPSRPRAGSAEGDVEAKDPHDRVVKRILSSPRHAADELRAVVPPELATRIDWSSLRVEPGSFVSRKRREYRTDLLFSAQLEGRKAYLYLLLEHQSAPDPWMPLRMLAYLVQIWEALRRRGLDEPPLPVIVPVVLHHGEHGWTAPRRFAELLDWSDDVRGALRSHLPDFEIIVDDLARVPEKALLERDMLAATRLLLWMLRTVRIGIDPAWIDRWASALNETEATDPEALRDLLGYLTSVDGGEAVLQALIDAGVSERVQEVVMGLRKQWEEQAADKGRAEGREVGRKEGRAELLLKQLRLKFGDLSPENERRVRMAPASEQDRWAERLLSADTLDDVWD